MSNASRTFGRAALIALLLGVAPVASAVQGTPPEQLIHQAVNGQPVGHPASMVETSAQAATPAPAPAPAPVPAEGVMTTTVEQMSETVERVEREERELAALEEKAAALRPGQYVWQPERAETGEVQVVVSLAEQKAYVYRADKLIGVTTVSTGRRGHRTPTGSFTILQKNRRHFSNLYNNAPMPNMQRLTWDGIALHAGALPGYPASHGCVRLPMEFSRLLFGATRLGGRVHIIADAPPSATGALAFATGSSSGRQLASAR